MKTKRPFAAIAAAAVACAALTMPSVANANSSVQTAENIRKLDIMLMVTSLRCRMGEHDFRAAYRDFSRNNLTHLNHASNTMRANLSARHGRKGSKRALDRVSVEMANQYGNGHPWLDCEELKDVAINLSQPRDHAHLSAEASRLLGPPRMAMASSR